MFQTFHNVMDCTRVTLPPLDDIIHARLVCGYDIDKKTKKLTKFFLKTQMVTSESTCEEKRTGTVSEQRMVKVECRAFSRDAK